MQEKNVDLGTEQTRSEATSLEESELGTEVPEGGATADSGQPSNAVASLHPFELDVAPGASTHPISDEVFDPVAAAAFGFQQLDLMLVMRDVASFFRSHLVFALLVAFFGHLPQAAYSIYRAFTMAESYDAIDAFLLEGHDLPIWVVNVESTFLSVVLAYAFFQFRDGKAFHAADAAQHGVSRLFPAMLVMVFCGFATVIGVFFFLIPGLIAFSALALAPVIVSAENLSIRKALSHSFAVVKGHRLKLGALLLAVLGIPAVIQILGFLALYPDDAVFSEPVWVARIQAGTLLEVTSTNVFGMIAAVSVAAAYYQLSGRDRQENVDVNALEEIFR